MRRLSVESDAVSSAGRAAHDIGLAAILGGNLFARVGMHPAVAEVSDPRERGRVVNRAWARFGVVNGLGLGAVLAGWLGARAVEARPRDLSARERPMAVAKDAAVAALTASGLASMATGMRFARMEPGGAVPLEDGDHAAAQATELEAKTKRALNVIGAVNLVSAATLATANATLAQANFRRPPLRRLLRRRY